MPEFCESPDQACEQEMSQAEALLALEEFAVASLADTSATRQALPRRYNPPLAGWVGGKRNLVSTLLPLFPPHRCYAEPFCGAGWLFFRKQPAAVEVINDMDGEVANLYRVIRDDYQALADKFKFVIASRKLFDEMKAVDPDKLDPVMRAWRLLYIQKLCYGGIYFQMRFGYQRKRAAQPNSLQKLNGIITASTARLKNTFVENLDYREILRRYDSEETFFYIDPPYNTGRDDYYGIDFPDYEYQLLASSLETIRGRFLITLNDIPLSHDLFRNFEIRKIEVTYSINRKINDFRGHEIVIANYPLPQIVQADKSAREPQQTL